MNIQIHHPAPGYDSYRAACVRSLFNADGIGFDLEADLPIDAEDWQIGLVVGPSGSGKSSIGSRIWGPEYLRGQENWPEDQPIIDAIAPENSGGDWQTVTSALSAVGLGDVPAWLRPYPVLSTGEKFRASLARLICEAPDRAVVDEFTSVVDRQIAKIGACAFAKAWRRTKGRVVLLSCHYDIIEWLAPDWIFDTAGGNFRWTRGCLRRPQIELEIQRTNWSWRPYFEPHHYLKLPRMIAATNYVGFVGGEPVAHIAVSTRQGFIEARACRLVVMPEWQGAGVGLKFLNAVCQMWLEGNNRYGIKVRRFFILPILAFARLYGDHRSGRRFRPDYTEKTRFGAITHWSNPKSGPERTAREQHRVTGAISGPCKVFAIWGQEHERGHIRPEMVCG